MNTRGTEALFLCTRTPVDAALSWANYGRHVFPVSPDKIPCIKWKKGATTDPKIIRRLWRKFPSAGVGVVTGDGLAVLDVDNHGGVDGGQNLRTLKQELGALPVTLSASTPSGGRHLYFTVPPEVRVKNSSGQLGAGLDVRGDGGMILVPCGLPGRAGDAACGPMMDLPAAWVSRLTPPARPAAIPTARLPVPGNGKDRTAYGASALAGELGAVASAAEGTRNARLNTAACKLGGLVAAGVLQRADVETALLGAATAAGLPEEEARKTIQSGMIAGMATPREIPAPGKATAKILAQPETAGGPDPAWKALPVFSDNCAPIPLHVARHIYLNRPSLVSVNGEFWQYNGKVFAEVSTDEIDRDSTAIILGRARRSVHGDIRHQLKLETLQPSDFFEPREASDYIALQNGMLDIRTCILHPHDPKWRARNLLPVVYDDMAECPRFTQALEEWLPDDPGARTLLEEFMGYCLVPDVSKEKALFLVGEGANGKGRFVRVLENLLGKSNVSGLPLMALRAERTFPTAGLVGKLLNICTETETTGGAQLDEGWIKALVSGDTVQVERKGCDPFSIRSNARFIIQSNNPPHISDKSEGFWRRLLLVRFPRSFHQEKQDPDLDGKLAAELPGILNLAIVGLRRLHERGHFEVTPAMIEALDGYRAENNPLATWREECLVQADPEWSGVPPRVSTEAAYKSYRDWCKDNGHNAYSRAKFGREMRRLGFPSVKYREGCQVLHGFEGVRLVLHM